MQGSLAPDRVLFSPFDGTKILLPFAQKNLWLLQTDLRDHQGIFKETDSNSVSSQMAIRIAMFSNAGFFSS